MREVCNQYRKGGASLSLDLSFRKYFKDAGEVFRLYRIDSVVRGTNQIAGSVEVRTPEGGRQHVGVSIQKFTSIEDLVLPPYFQYAVVDRDGHTIFHSDKARNSVSNFLSDTIIDAGVQAAMAYKKGVTLDVQYDGMPIRAHLRSLQGEEGWTLIVYRGHALVDKISSFSSSLSIISWLLTMLLTLALFGFSVIVPRPRGKKLLPSAILCATDVRIGAVGVALGLVGLPISYCDDSGFFVVVALFWPALVGFTIFIPAWFRLRRAEKPSEGSSDDGWVARAAAPLRSRLSPRVVEAVRRSIWIRVCVLFSLVFSSSIVPMLAWQNYFRTELSTGLAAHLEEVADNTVREKVEDARQQMKMLAYVGEGDLGKCKGDNEKLNAFLEKGVVGLKYERVTEVVTRVLCGERRPRSNLREDTGAGLPPEDAGAGWPFDALSPFLAHSPLTWQAMWRRSEETVRTTRAVSGAMEIVMESPPVDHAGSWSDEGWRWTVVFFGAGFVLFMCYSAVRVKFGYARRVVHPPFFSLRDMTKKSLPERLLLIRRSEVEVRRLKEKLNEHFSVKCFTANQSGVFWQEFRTARHSYRSSSKSAPKPVVFVVEHFRDAASGASARELAAELEGKRGDGTVVICSDVLPLYHMGPGTVDERDDMQPAWEPYWRGLLDGFEVRILCGALTRRGKVKCSSEAAREVLGAELEANADFEDLVVGIGKGLATTQGLSESQLRERALREFHAAAQSRFKVIWAVSSFDERAQLYALAHGGSPNRERPAAISSLVSRGLITSTDPMELCSEAFRQFIVEDLDDSLDDWRRKGHRDWWRVTWLPLVLFAGLGLLFFINSNPEAIGVIAAIGAALIGLVPIVTSLLRVGQVVQPTVPSNNE